MVIGYEVHDDFAKVIVQRRDKIIVESEIDISDLATVKSFDGEWYACWSNNKQNYYIRGSYKKDDGKYTSIELSNYLMRPAYGYVVDHKNGNTLCNRRSNLRVCTKAENSQNVRVSKRNKYSNIRGVTYNPKHGKWYARSYHQKVNHYIGCYDTKQEAAQAICAWRSETMPFSVEGGIHE